MFGGALSKDQNSGCCSQSVEMVLSELDSVLKTGKESASACRDVLRDVFPLFSGSSWSHGRRM